ncbi:MAG: RNA 2',3'-cyclic phosphodiesterase [Hyphomicrobiaceae bacterium]
MPRLFTAITLPDLLAERLALIRGHLVGGRFLEKENLHLTLRFAGDIDNRTADSFADLLAQIAFPAFQLEIVGLGAFGGDRPRSLHAIVKPTPELERLQADNERAARAAGLAPESRRFTPHVTIARLKGTRSREVAAYLGAQGGLSAGPFLVERFCLMSSRPSTGGPPYVVEDVYDCERG